jgi:cyanophycinase-like exopeptidase
VIAGTSAGATALGRTMILGGERPDVSAAASFIRAARRITPHLSTTDHSKTMPVVIVEPKGGL